MGRDYERLSIEKFGHQLLATGDLDPVYIALKGMDWGKGQISRWLVAYWCFYHCGVASYMSELEQTFWVAMKMAAANEELSPIGERWPRAKERRHFRGAQAINAVDELSKRYPQPEQMIDSLLTSGDTFREMSTFVKTHRGFGPWISFKVCDMMERVMGNHVDFSEAEVFMFKNPREAALMLYEDHHEIPIIGRLPDESARIRYSVKYLTSMFNDTMAPPGYDRPVGLQEIETILCKWKSHRNRHYPINNDIDEITRGLDVWLGTCDSVRQFKSCMPTVDQN